MGDLTGVDDVISNSFTLDPTGQFFAIQGYSQKASGNESWIVSVAVNPEVPAKPTPNFQNIPFRTGSESQVTWDAVQGATGYVVQINNLSTGTVERKVNVTPQVLAVTIANPGNYAIWIQAVGATGKLSPWSDATRFTVVIQPPAISFSGSTLRWTDIAASQYRLWVNDQNGVKVIDRTGAETSFDVSLPFGSYTAWVKPDAASWSTPYRFGITMMPWLSIL